MKKDDENPIDPRAIRRKSNNRRDFDKLKGFAELEIAEFKQTGKGVFYAKKQEHQKELDKRSKELEYAPFDHDRKSRAKSAPLPILKSKLVPDDLKTPEIQTENAEKVVFAKSVKGKANNKRKKRIKQREK
jgi:hypothetical protein